MKIPWHLTPVEGTSFSSRFFLPHLFYEKNAWRKAKKQLHPPSAFFNLMSKVHPKKFGKTQKIEAF